MYSFGMPGIDGAGTIAYTSDRSGTFDIWLYYPMVGFGYPLTRGLGEEFSVPYWSPDRQRIAFIGKGNIVYVTDARTGFKAKIDQVEPYTLLDWSPDSRLLCYAKDGKILIYDIYTYTAGAIPQEGVADVQWFLSGRELLYAAPDTGGNTQLYQIGADGTNQKQLTHNTEGPLHNVRLSPDGRYALYTSPGASISLISTVELATGKVYKLEGGPLSKNFFPEWSPDSSHIVYSATASDQNRYYSLITTESRTGGNKRTWASSDCYSSVVVWSPDGMRLAYLSGCGGEGRATGIWGVDFRQPHPIKLVGDGRITSLRWYA